MKVVGVQTFDEEFAVEERKFKSIEACVRILVTDVSQYLNALQESLYNLEVASGHIADIIGDCPSSDINGDLLSAACQQILGLHVNRFKMQVQTTVIPPLNSLLLSFQGPHKVIRKRYDKLLDFESASLRLRGCNTRDLDQLKLHQAEVQSCRANYEALNSQLLEDLPHLCALSSLVINDCLRHLSHVQTSLLACVSDELTYVLQNHCSAINNIHLIGHTCQPSNLPTAAEGDLLSSEVKNIAQCQALYSFAASTDLELSLYEGQIVSILAEHDLDGNSEWWLVTCENGQQGYVPANYLSPHVDFQQHS
jgi:hypothetical protein